MPEQDPEKQQDLQLLTNSESTQNPHLSEFQEYSPEGHGDVAHLMESLQDSQFQQQLRLELQFSHQDEEYQNLIQQMEIRNWD